MAANGEVFDENTYVKAKHHFIQAACGLKDTLSDINEFARRLVHLLQQKHNFPADGIERMTLYLARFMQDVEAGKIDLKKAVAELEINYLANHWLQEAKETKAPHCIRVLVLARWGLEQKVPMDCPEADRQRLELQVSQLLRWKPADVMEWLADDPNGRSKQEQRQNLRDTLEHAGSPQSAAALVLNTIYSCLRR